MDTPCKDCRPHWAYKTFGGITLCPLHASAPDLLAALVEVTPEVYGCNRARHTFITEPDCADCQRCECARADIARARGAAEGVRKAKGE